MGTPHVHHHRYQAKLINWRFMANALWRTSETIERMVAVANI